jgi:light-regulated signal transduction histidine kinase (bacteriophytochrome)
VLAASILESKARLAALGAEGKDTLFSLRLAELEIIAHTRTLLENHRTQATQLTSHANALVSQVRKRVADIQRDMANQQAMSAFILVLVCLGNVLLAFLIVNFTTRVLSRHETDLRDAKNLAETVNRELDAFTYSVSHDLQAPLRAIDGFSEALLEDYGDKLDAAGKSYLNYLQEGSREMSELVDALLELSRCTRSELTNEQVNLSALAETACKNLQKADPIRQVDVRIAPQIAAKGDPRLLKTMLENLFSNAWKYTSKKANAYIEFGSEQQGKKIIYFIRDNGVGFDMTNAHRLFLPFRRLHKASEFEGLGIGLTTVQRIVHRHGGKIWVQSMVNVGTTFYFTLTASRTEKPNRKTTTNYSGVHHCA